MEKFEKLTIDYLNRKIKEMESISTDTIQFAKKIANGTATTIYNEGGVIFDLAFDDSNVFSSEARDRISQAHNQLSELHRSILISTGCLKED